VLSHTEVPKRYRYTGKERDEESGLYYHGVRHYAPWLGRWTSCDPAGLVDGQNIYSYAKGNPIQFTDPMGTQSEYTVRGNPDKMIVENPNAMRNYNSAVEATLEREFGLGSPEKNNAAYQNKVASLNDDAQQTGKRLNLKSKKGFARSISNRINARFYRHEGASPSWPYSPNQIKLLKAGRAPDPLQQVEHLDNLAENPGAIPNAKDVYLTEAGRKGGIPKNSPHGQKTWGEIGKRLRAWQTKNTSVPPVTGAKLRIPISSTPSVLSKTPGVLGKFGAGLLRIVGPVFTGLSLYAADRSFKENKNVQGTIQTASFFSFYLRPLLPRFAARLGFGANIAGSVLSTVETTKDLLEEASSTPLERGHHTPQVIREMMFQYAPNQMQFNLFSPK
jgi:RHS repeat-associated protein